MADMPLQEQIEDMRKKEERLEKQLAETLNENKRLQEPLQKVNYYNTQCCYTCTAYLLATSECYFCRPEKRLLNYKENLLIMKRTSSHYL